MARQPFKFKARPGMHYRIGADSLAARPHLAAMVGRCLAEWSQVELQLALSLAAMLRTSAEAAAAVFLSLQNARAQRDALLGAARVTLSPDDLAIFDAVMDCHRSLSGERNNLAHGIFGTAEDEPDWLLWHASAKHAAWLTEIYRAEAVGSPLTDPHGRLRDEMFVYTADDLSVILNDISQLWSACFDLHCYLKADTAEWKARHRRGLLSSDLVRSQMDRASKRAG